MNQIRRSHLVVVALLVASCSEPKTPSAGSAPEAKAPSPVQPGELVRLQGAGASLPAPLYQRWFKTFSASRPNVQVDYQSVGSGSGVKSFIDHTVDFGASDAAMTPEEIARVDGGAQLLPMTAGAIVLAYNLEGVAGLKLSRKAYTGIFLGTVTKWNDPEIVRANPGAQLPDAPINVVVRADSSGTSFVFTKHLSAVNPEFAKSPGTDKMPNWPVGTRSKGNEGVTASLKTTPGAIGYVEYGYARSQNLTFAQLENKAGQFVAYSTAAAQAALASSKLPDDLIVWNADPEAREAWPIVTYTWLLLYKKYPAAKQAVLVDLLKYSFGDGQREAEPLGYVPLPQPVVEKVTAALTAIKGEG
jgi:phosphate transport system substrate-binding protein